jgi:methylmalonyl-CoA epimerase
VADQGFRYVPFTVAGFTIELLCPYREDSVIQRYLERRGPGVHHVSFMVPDLDAALAELERLGVRVAHVHDYPADVAFEGHHWREAFIHPRDAFGVLLHLAEKRPV